MVPLVVVLLIALTHLVSASTSFRKCRPNWTKSIFEDPAPRDDRGRKVDQASIYWTIGLGAFAILALAAQIVKLISFPDLLVHASLQLASWTIVALVLALTRPRACPIGLAAFYIPSIIVEAAGIGHDKAIGIGYDVVLPSFRNGSHQLVLFLSVASVLMLLVMPMRVETRDGSPIASAGAAPSNADRTPEEALRLWQFLTVSWVAPLLRVGNARQLQREDIWRLPYTFQSRRLADAFRDVPGSSIVWRLVRANALDIIVLMVASVTDVLCTCASPILLHQLLLIMEAPERDNRAALVYATLTFAVRTIDAQNAMLTLWFERRCYERSRGELIMMIYEKVLRRKVIVSKDKENDSSANGVTDGSAQDSQGANGSADKKPAGPVSKWNLLKRVFAGPAVAKSKGPASTGQVLNLVRSDAYDMAKRFSDIKSFVNTPVGLIFTTYLIWWLMGPSCFLAVAIFVVGHIVNILLAKIRVKWRRTLQKAIDARIQQSSQFIESLRHLRWYGWHEKWLGKVMAARRHELNTRLIAIGLQLTTYMTSVFTSNTFPVLAFFAYTALAGHELRIDLIFPAIQLFGDLQMHMRYIPELITTYLNALVSIERMDAFLSEDERVNIATSDPTTGAEGTHGRESEMPPVLKLENCSFAWPGTDKPTLRNVTLTVEVGLTVVHGKLGSGKTALLQAFLGELDLLGGKVVIPNESVGYCAQTPWLQGVSIRDNILFHTPYDEQRYHTVLDACALLPDLASFKDGDQSHIGENGVGLSGGQRARVALARALYSRARILLLDDPVSALDHTTAEIIILKAFASPVVEGRVVVLVTHRTRMVQHIATQFVVVSDGCVSISENPFEDTSASVPEQDAEQPEAANSGKATSVDQASAFIEEEKRESGGIKGTVWLTFILAAKWWWLFLAVMLTLTRIINFAKTWFYKAWGEAYEKGATDVLWASMNIPFRKPLETGTFMEHDGVEIVLTSLDPSDYLPSPQENLTPWLICLFLLAVLNTFSLMGYAVSQLTAIYATSKNMYAAIIKRVTHATFRYYDVTPTGRILNRLTSDISVLDNALAYFGQTIFSATSWAMSVTVIAFVSPLFLILAAVLMFAFLLVFNHFLPTSRNLKRLESSSLSPIFTHFGELLQSQGLVTVRAFHSQQSFTESTIEILDQVQSCTHFYWSVQNWLSYRYQNMGSLASFVLTVSALMTNLTPGLTAFMLTYASALIHSTRQVCIHFSDMQTEFISVERIVEVLNIEQEPPGTRAPPASWPRFGAPITFRNVTVRYAPHLDPSLRDITLSIPGGRITAVIGRTGSGKSTLALALLNIVRAEPGGSIEIDGQDLADIDVQALRQRVTFIPQEPVLFDGTVRENLDPVGEFDEAACADVLARIATSAGQAWALGDRVEAGGHNFSHGQRQLLGLTRAVLRRSPVVILDEATASIDLETSLMLQAVIREEMAETTVLTIAHRVEAVRGADYVVVLEDGRVKRQGPVGEVLAAEGRIDGRDHGDDET